MSDVMSFEELLASPYLQFDLDDELLPHLLTFEPVDTVSVAPVTPIRRRPSWEFDEATASTTTAR
jgi:hypothetical protein